jgi:hypothetical protein
LAERVSGAGEDWPELRYEAWQDTCAGLHLRLQVAGKLRLAQTPWLNHSWHVPLYVTPRGLTTGPIPHGGRSFDVGFDLVQHQVEIRSSSGGARQLPLQAESTAAFYARAMQSLRELDLTVAIHELPSEIPDGMAFSQDTSPRAYDRAAVERFQRVLVQTERIFARFRTRFLGKSSPVHFFWGGFDLAVTRFSGRAAPLHPGGMPGLPDAVAREAYSHEVSSAGFWPGGPGYDAVFYSYAYPEPDGYRGTRVRPDGARFDATLGEFLLPYAAVRQARDPEAALLEFLQSTYEAAADNARWDRTRLECPEGRPGVPRVLNARAI